MPVEKVVRIKGRCWGLWRLTESPATLTGMLADFEQIPDTISHEKKRVEWIAGRLLTRHLLEEIGGAYQGIAKNEDGKPHLIGSSFRLSLSHSFPFVAAIIDAVNEVGIDLEQPKEKLIRIAHRVLSPIELRDAGDDIKKHCVYWCAKEALIKLHGKKDLILAENLQIMPFELKNEGYIPGRIIVGPNQSMVNLYYRVFDNFVLSFTLPPDGNHAEPN